MMSTLLLVNITSVLGPSDQWPDDLESTVFHEVVLCFRLFLFCFAYRRLYYGGSSTMWTVDCQRNSRILLITVIMITDQFRKVIEEVSQTWMAEGQIGKRAGDQSIAR